MRPTRIITTVMLLAAFGTAACSKRDRSKKDAHASDDVNASRLQDVKPSRSEKAVEPPKPSEPPSFADGQTAYSAKKYGEATAIFEAYTERRPSNAWGHYMLGLSAWKSGDLPKSEKAFDKALSIDPRHIKSLVNQSRLFIAQSRHDEALARLERANEIDPENREVNRLFAHTYHLLGRTADAIAVYRTVLANNEYDTWTMNNLGMLLLETGQSEESVTLLTRAVELRQEVAEFHNNLGLALEQIGHFRAAADAYGSALLADPGYHKARENLTRVEAVKTGAEVK
jgi:tetratricopeptide (TPR) repeat protein